MSTKLEIIFKEPFDELEEVIASLQAGWKACRVDLSILLVYCSRMMDGCSRDGWPPYRPDHHNGLSLRQQTVLDMMRLLLDQGDRIYDTSNTPRVFLATIETTYRYLLELLQQQRPSYPQAEPQPVAAHAATDAPT